MNAGACDSVDVAPADPIELGETSEDIDPPLPIADNAFLDDAIVAAIPITAFAVFIAVKGNPKGGTNALAFAFAT